MNIKKNAMCFILIVLFILAVSCAGKTEESFEVDLLPTDSDGIDLEGAVFAFGSNWINEYKMDEGISDSGDKMNARYAAIEDKFNITFNLLDSSHCSEGIIMANAASGLFEDIPDAMDIAGDQAFSMYKKDMLFPFDEITTINISDEKYGSENFVKRGADWGGHQWCIYPNNWQLAPQFTGAIIFDNELLGSHSLRGKPYELMENGEWTWASFEELCKTMTFTEGEDTYVSLCYESIRWICESAILSNGGQGVIDGVFGYGEPEAVEALEWLAGLYEAGVMYKETGIGKLNEGFTAFQYSQMQEATLLDNDGRYAVTLTDYGVMPFPWGPKAEYGKTCSSFVIANKRFICCNALAVNDKDDFGLILDYMFEPLDGDEPVAWRDALRYTLHHDEDIENFQWIYENLQYNYSQELAKIRSSLEAAFGKILRGADTASAAMNALSAAAAQSIEEFNAK